MKQKRFLGFLPAFCLLALAPLAIAQDDCADAARALELGQASGQFGSTVGVDLTVTSDGDVQGFVAAFELANTAAGEVIDIVPADALTGAEIVESTVGDGSFGVIGVVVDIDGEGPDSIPAGTDVLVATVEILCGDEEAESAINFADGTYATVEGGPVLDNILVIGGLSIGVSDELCLNDGAVRCTPPPDQIIVQDGDNGDGSSRCGTSTIAITNRRDVEGFVVAICSLEGPALDSVELAGAATVADFFEVEVDDEGRGFTAGVVLDLIDPQPEGVFIPAGVANPVLSVGYCCPDQPVLSDPILFDVEPCDALLGDPAKDNILVIGGQSIGVSDGLELVGGVFTCNALETTPPPEPGTTEFHCSGRDGGELEGRAGGSVEVCLSVLNSEDNAVGELQPDHIQGFSMALTFCDDLACEESLDIGGTILEALGAEFVSIQCDNDGVDVDGDGRELIIGVLIDALPPFDGATIAPLPDPQPVGYVNFAVSPDARCGSQCPIEFTDGINGRGRVPISNLVSADNKSRRPSGVRNCIVEIVNFPVFYRGDCNFSLGGAAAVDIADAAAVVSYLFLPGTWQFQPGCLDACDANDDGRVDLADSVAILQYLFQGGRTPPAPGPGWDPDTQQPTGHGPDPTEDKLDCPAGVSCELIPD